MDRHVSVDVRWFRDLIVLMEAVAVSHVVSVGEKATTMIVRDRSVTDGALNYF